MAYVYKFEHIHYVWSLIELTNRKLWPTKATTVKDYSWSDIFNQFLLFFLPQDDEVPVKGHGLIVLTRLVKEKDEETEKNIESVIKMFQVFILKQS